MTLPRKDVEVQTEQFAFSGTGEILSYTVVQEPPEGFEDQAPYVLALVKLTEGPVVTAQITDVEGPVAIGDAVEMVTRRLTTEGPKGMIVYGYKFRQVLPRQN
jgi:uncharacterized OB-fold protein